MKRLAYIALSILTVVGAYGLWQRATVGLIDTALTNIVTWGLWVALYIYFLGLSAGGFVLSSMVYALKIKQLERVGKLAVLQAFVCVAMGLTMIWIDLGHPLRFFKVFLSPNPTSLLSWESFVYLAYVFVLLGELWLLSGVASAEELPPRRARTLKAFATVGIPIAVGVHWGTGALFAVVKARPEWHTGITPIAFLASAVMSGTALLMVLAAIFDRKDEGHRQCMEFMAKLAAATIVFDLLLLFSEALVVWYGGVEHEVAAFRQLYFGPYWYATWIVHLLLGSLVPLAIFSSSRLRSNYHLLVTGAGLVVLGIVGYRLNIVIPAQVDPPFHEFLGAFHHIRNTKDYFPALMEWLSSAGIVAGGIWMFLIVWSWMNRAPSKTAVSS
ncbi:MAG: hypothetical protein D6753_06460 [Planctomycetota bacterium]|nr:MAG: hypothetical protein D6753_06460 [Planctomycetota bacterium]